MQCTMSIWALTQISILYIYIYIYGHIVALDLQVLVDAVQSAMGMLVPILHLLTF